jgi:pimeloyl-ACP methyl ester carboxylesterase
MSLPEPRLIDLDGHPVAYRTWGTVGDQPLVFWHALGSATSGAYLAEVAPRLVADHQLHVVALDAPGFGHTPPLARDAYAVPALVERFALLVDRLGLRRPILMGHSWGAVLAAFLASRVGADARALILLDSGHLDFQDLPGFDAAASWEELLAEAREPARRLSAATWQEYVAETHGEVSRWRSGMTEILAGGVRREGNLVHQIPTPEVSAAARLGLLGVRVSSAYPGITTAGIPVLLVTATEPPEAGERNRRAAEAFRERVPSATVFPLPGARHDLFLDAGPELAAILSAWLAPILEERA